MRLARVLYAAALLGGALNGSAFYQDYGDISVELSSSISGAGGFTSRGYAAVRIKAANSSPDKAHRVEIRFPLEGGFSISGPGRLKSFSKTIQIAPDSTAEVYIYQPRIFSRLRNPPMKGLCILTERSKRRMCARCSLGAAVGSPVRAAAHGPIIIWIRACRLARLM